MPPGHEHLVKSLQQDLRFVMMGVIDQSLRKKLCRAQTTICQRFTFCALYKALCVLHALTINPLKKIMFFMKGQRKIICHVSFILILRNCVGPEYPLSE
ncbi:hypothetical protein P775_12540 [Puniceibacterium antarcticum]|uniref:Uncharacterized protein n=1 Tax=Puniceibacterium antarcticum TaxID=1206336 RepID=A0A2G8RED0_9RHOB|nr:hypothetical protein P775_12540 [Puniceibacterium antarcticum]